MRGWRTAQRIAHSNLKSFAKRAFSGSHPVLRDDRSIAQLLHQSAESTDVSVNGWVRSIRKQKRIAFAALNDGSTTSVLQAVLKPQDAVNISSGAAVKLQGDWTASQGSGQSYELRVSSAEILGENDAENNPLQPKYQTPEFLRTIPHLRPRIPANALLLRLRSQLIASVTNYFVREGFVQTHTPIITSSDCEGAGEVFTISADASSGDTSNPVSVNGKPDVEHFFRVPKYLTVSAQLHLEALAQAVNKVWTLSPTFRAERSDTPRHLSEFYMLEAEMCFVDDLDTIMNLVEGMLRSAVEDLKLSQLWVELLQSREMRSDGGADGHSNEAVEAAVLEQRWEGILSPQWPRITYARAIDFLRQAHSNKRANFNFTPSYEDGLHAEHERYLASTVGLGSPIFVTHYPRDQKPFYMPSTTSDSSSDTVACFDLLVPDLCELVGGSLREHRSVELLDAMREKGVGGGSLEWYRDLRRFGSVPHGGFGLGFDRLIAYLAGVSSVRDVVAFPRWYGRCDC